MKFVLPVGSFFWGALSAFIAAPSQALAISSRMSSTRHTVTRGESLMGFGKRPVLTPAHHADLQTGISPGSGGEQVLSPTIWGRRRKPVVGKGIGAADVALACLIDDIGCPQKLNWGPTPMIGRERDALGRSVIQYFGRRSVVERACHPSPLACWASSGACFQAIGSSVGRCWIRIALHDPDDAGPQAI
jgi:hypothetical protein